MLGVVKLIFCFLLSGSTTLGAGANLGAGFYYY
jgi:hypothetical protein